MLCLTTGNIIKQKPMKQEHPWRTWLLKRAVGLRKKDLCSSEHLPQNASVAPKLRPANSGNTNPSVAGPDPFLLRLSKPSRRETHEKPLRVLRTPPCQKASTWRYIRQKYRLGWEKLRAPSFGFKKAESNKNRLMNLLIKGL